MTRRYLAALLALLTVMVLLLADIWYVARGGGCCRLPVLMYHHFAQESPYGTIVSFDKFREQMTALRDAGYQAVTIPQIIDYVENETPLPEKPVLITMDDGYTSNLVNAAPVLEELGLRATVFVIGVNEGEEIYIHNGEPLSPPRFSYEEAAPWVEKGVIDVQSHTFDMHQVASYGYSCRDGMLAMDGETTTTGPCWRIWSSSAGGGRAAYPRTSSRWPFPSATITGAWTTPCWRRESPSPSPLMSGSTGSPPTMDGACG